MQRRDFLAAMALLPLAGCSNTLGPGEPPEIYILGGGAAPPAPPPGPKVPWSLSVLRPTTMDSLDTVRIPVAKADGTMDFYAGSQFPDKVPALVQTALVAGFDASGRIDEISNARDALQADYILVTDIRHFEAKYDSPNAPPTVIVALSAKLATGRGRRILANFTTRHSVPATADSIGAAARAFEAALRAAVADVVGWTLAAPLPPVKP